MGVQLLYVCLSACPAVSKSVYTNAGLANESPQLNKYLQYTVRRAVKVAQLNYFANYCFSAMILSLL